MNNLLWTGLLTGVAWADWRTRSVAWSTLLLATALTLIEHPPWIDPAGWFAAALTGGFAASYVGWRTRRHPGVVIWGLADYWIASLTMLWMHNAWLMGLWLIVAAFGVQIVVSAALWLIRRPVPSSWPWLVGYWGVWCLYLVSHTFTG
ncbi:hypothetical protein SAMN00768000_3708 [Sulfobacillus thermosulfidooxidans DSM 9293]|uniref:Uncharacterized protein n=2 Tax=Sulfobacillus thermosulfidooxidans TaxID=28034 RepID=A0A1W1WPN5_SULTA|nr:hypothetical protein [Sulfobacillus thermosulfidooxidans]PSR23698.1 MAG: hypothetical protein C7B47_15690 [Sulfobacillus thermosulfidooxidans]SMC08169.1 hypothetical protein SAMN00768000_3708 [Sulfobacillus thermosulfidooxidans DSM 9293]